MISFPEHSGLFLSPLLGLLLTSKWLTDNAWLHGSKLLVSLPKASLMISSEMWLLIVVRILSWPWPYLPLFALSWPIYIIPESSESSLSTQCQSQTLWLHSESTHVLAMHSRTLWLPCISLTHSQPEASSIHSFSTQHYSTFFLLVSSPLPMFHWSHNCGWAKPDHIPPSLNTSQSVFPCPLYICSLSCPLYIYLSHHSLPSTRFSMSHSQFPVSIYPHFIYLYSILPSTLL